MLRGTATWAARLTRTDAMTTPQPTPNLRFINRSVPAPEYSGGHLLIGGGVVCRSVRILQQFWVNNPAAASNPATGMGGEWRDVSLVETEGAGGE